ncbi:ABC transporter permease [candidate division KSB1 bacterium]
MNKKPDKLAEYLLYLTLPESESSFLLGDYEEEFNYILERKGAFKARLWYWILILESMPGFILNSIYRSAAMIKNYLKTAIRNMKKNKLSSFINILGLSVAIGCSIIFFLLLEVNYTSDRFHKNAEKIFMIVYSLEGDKSVEKWGNSPRALGPVLEQEFPQIENAVRVSDRSAIIRNENRIFEESIRFVDPDFLEMFTFPLYLGNKDVLSERNSLILSKEMSEKYFGDENPLNRELTVIFDTNNRETFIVKGVAEEFPVNSSFAFDILTSIENSQNIYTENCNDWGEFTSATFIQLNNPDDILTIAAQMDRFIQRHNSERIDRPIASFDFEPLPTLSWESQDIRMSISSGSTPEALIMLFVIGLLLLVQACFNYVNISLASATRRLKEIGLRKVVGSQRSQIIKQFLGENLLLCFFALTAGILLTEFIFLPGLSTITGDPEELTLLAFFTNIHLWMFFVFLLIITGIGAGIYPALFISRLQPVNIITGKLKIGGKRRLSSVLLSIQFGITFLIICLVVAFWENNQYQLHRDWGYNKDNLISIQLESSEQFEALNNSIIQNPDITQTAGTAHQIGISRRQAAVEIAAVKHEVIRFDVGHNYLETMGIRLKQGRFFNQGSSTDKDAAVIINETFVQNMGWKDAINQNLRFENKTYKVIGVVEDFHYEYFFNEIQPVMFRISQKEDIRYLTLRIQTVAGVQTSDKLKTIWRRLFPERPYNFFFQDSVFENGFRNTIVITQIFAAIAVIGLVISCMGLFGLVTLMISKRTKALSIHKVMGASVLKIANLVTKRFIIIILLSTVIALPGGYIFLKFLLDGIYKYHMPLSANPFILATLITMFTAIITIASQVYKSAVRNPIDALRCE